MWSDRTVWTSGNVVVPINTVKRVDVGLTRYNRPKHYKNIQECGNERRCRPTSGIGFRQFCEETTLHGLKHVGKRDSHMVLRLLWALTFIISIITGCCFIYNVYKKWDGNPVIISIATKPTDIDTIPFPAVTICPPRILTKRFVEELQREENKYRQYNDVLINDICHLGREMRTDGPHVREEMKEAIHNFFSKLTDCENLLSEGDFGFDEDFASTNKIYKRAFLYTFRPPIFHSREHYCCSINAVKPEYLYRNLNDKNLLERSSKMLGVDWNVETGYVYNHTADMGTPIRPDGVGTELRIDYFTGKIYCNNSINRENFEKVIRMYLLWEPNICPGGLVHKLLPHGNLFCFHSNKIACGNVKLRSTATIFVAVHNPAEAPDFIHGAISLSLGGETSLKIKAQFTNASRSIKSMDPARRDCYFSSEKDLQFFRTYTEWNCKLDCVANETIRLCGCLPDFLPESDSIPTCSHREKGCYFDLTRIRDFDFCKCLPPCQELSYQVFEHYKPLEDGGPNSKDKLRALLSVYFMEQRFIPYVRSEFAGFSEFIASTGGILGLFVGFSVISIVEILYFSFLSIYYLLRRGYRKISLEGRSILRRYAKKY